MHLFPGCSLMAWWDAITVSVFLDVTNGKIDTNLDI